MEITFGPVMTAREFMKYAEKRRRNPLVIGKCGYCTDDINEQQGIIEVPAGKYHPDCYWAALGDEIEKHPIGHAGIGAHGSNLDKSDLEVLTA